MKHRTTPFPSTFEGSGYFVPTHSEASCRALTNETSLCSDGGGVLLACSSVANFSLVRNAQWWFLFSRLVVSREMMSKGFLLWLCACWAQLHQHRSCGCFWSPGQQEWAEFSSWVYPSRLPTGIHLPSDLWRPVQSRQWWELHGCQGIWSMGRGD